jgi:hypothetical protein
MDWNLLGKALLIAGGIIIIMGLILLLVGHVPFVGKLPADIYIQKGSFSLYFPIVTCILISLILTALLSLAFWLWR